jgi:glycine hydroxymethyltransferase
MQGGPAIHAIAAKAVALQEAHMPFYKRYMEQVIINTQKLVEGLQQLGYDIVSGGSDNHLFVIDLSAQGITGIEGEQALEAAGIVTNRNLIPFDTNPPAIASGVRIGSAAITTRGLTSPDMPVLVNWINAILEDPHSETLQSRIRREVNDYMKDRPLFAETGTEM